MHVEKCVFPECRKMAYPCRPQHIGPFKCYVMLFSWTLWDTPLVTLITLTRSGGAGKLSHFFYLGYHREINNRWRVIPSMALYVTTIDTYNTSHISSFIHHVWM